MKALAGSWSALDTPAALPAAATSSGDSTPPDEPGKPEAESPARPPVAVLNDLLRRKLQRAGTEALIQALITLTHRIHDEEDEAADDLRAQREHVIVEIKRRADRPAVRA